MPTTLEDLRRFAVGRSLFAPTTLKRALHKLGFVQADPIRAPARAQDLVLRHRVRGYRVGDLERRYATLGVHEDFFINYGYVTSELQALMHPRSEAGVPAAGLASWPAERKKRARLVLEFVRDRGEAHPREVDAHFAHGTVRNYWGGVSSATTHLLDAMHYRGLVRVVRRDGGVRVYAACAHAPRPPHADGDGARLDRLIDLAVRLYAPVPDSGLSSLVRRLRYAVPQWRSELGGAIGRAKRRLARAHIGGVDWYWPADDDETRAPPEDEVRLLTPFDPVVWDRARFEMLWGWAYRFEAYTPVARRKLGYYAMPLLWRDRVIGWANLSLQDRCLKTKFGYVGGGPPRERIFKRALEAELHRIKVFLYLDD
jgi:uncharacterized protein YcaQ